MAAPDGTAGRRTEKSARTFRTISEVASELDVPQHVLRFWETKFSQVRPMKRGGGRRYYRPEDVALLGRIRELLYTEGYTIKGVQKLMREGAVWPPRHNAHALMRARESERGARGGGLDDRTRRELEALLDELVELRETLRRAG